MSSREIKHAFDASTNPRYARIEGNEDARRCYRFLAEAANVISFSGFGPLRYRTTLSDVSERLAIGVRRLRDIMDILERENLIQKTASGRGLVIHIFVPGNSEF